MAFAGLNGVQRGDHFEFKALAAETASTTHNVFHPTGPGMTSIVVKVTAASGTTPTLTVIVEGSDDETNWFQLGVIGSGGYSVGTTATAPTNITTTGTSRAAFVTPEFIRTRSVVGGTTPSFTYSVEASIG